MPPRDALAVDHDVLLVEMPAARAHLQGRDLLVEPVALARLLEGEPAPDRLDEVDLPLDQVVPDRRVAVLEVGHVAVRARVERVDDHLGVDRPGDLDAAALERLGQRGDAPVAFADGLRLGQEVGPLAGVEPLGTRRTRGQQLAPARLEGAVQPGHQLERLLAENGLETGKDRRVDLHARGQREVHEISLEGEGRESKKPSTSRRLEPMRVGAVSSRSSGRPKRFTHSVA